MEKPIGSKTGGLTNRLRISVPAPKKASQGEPAEGAQPSRYFGKKVAGRERCYEEATRIAPKPAEPHGLRRCGGPEHPVGLFRGSSVLNFEINASVDFLPPPLSECHATSSSRESNLQKLDECWIPRQSNVNLNGYGLRARDGGERLQNREEHKEKSGRVGDDAVPAIALGAIKRLVSALENA